MFGLLPDFRIETVTRMPNASAKFKEGIMNLRIFFHSLAILLLFASFTTAQNKPRLKVGGAVNNGKEMSIIVTAVPHGDSERVVADKLQPTDFAVLENNRQQRIVSVKPAAEAPMAVAVVVQDNLDWRVNIEIKELKNFIEKLPDGSRVMTAYLTVGGAIVTQELTDNRKQAAETLRIIRGGTLFGFSPFEGVRGVASHFDNPRPERRMMIVVSDGFDFSRGFAGASPFFSVELDRAIRECQRRGIAVYTIYAPGSDRNRMGRFEFNYGQASLVRLADETGGESYLTGMEFTNFSPYLYEFSETTARQWLIAYKSATTGSGFRRIEVTTDFDVHLHHQSGYFPTASK